jgi:hypothetical protein
MKAPHRKRPQVRELMTPPPAAHVLDNVAERAHYVGSPEHKRHPSFAGPPAPRATSTLCDVRFADQQEMLTNWLKEAIRQGQVSAGWSGDFPRYVWMMKDGMVYEARLVNQGDGGYKGWRLEEHEYLKELE